MLRLFNKHTKILIFRQFSSRAVDGLPFQYTSEQAIELLQSNKSIFDTTTHQSHSSSSLIPYRQQWKSLYLPFHSVDVRDLKSSYIGEYGMDRQETQWVYVSTGKGGYWTTEEVTVTDWYRCQGSMPCTSYPFGSTLETQVYAGFEYPREFLERALQMSDVHKIRRLINTELHPHLVQPFTMKVKMALSLIVSRLHKLECQRAKMYIKKVHRADHGRINTLDVHLDHAAVDWISFHLPCWLYENRQGNLSLYQFINGYNGRIDGQPMLSWWKAGTAGALGGALWSVLFNSGRFFIPGALLPGMLVAGVTKLYVHWKYHQGQVTQSNETLRNANFETCSIDEQLSDTEIISTNKHVRLNSELACLLGLSEQEDVTMLQVKTAYHQKLKQYHPDVYKGKNTEFASLMTKQLNTAYQSFHSLHK